MTNPAKLLQENAGNGNNYSGLFECYGLQFTIVHVGGAFVPHASPDNPKKPNWQIEAATRLCQSAAYERVQELKRGEKS